jgi:hypothetical protein
MNDELPFPVQPVVSHFGLEVKVEASLLDAHVLFFDQIRLQAHGIDAVENEMRRRISAGFGRPAENLRLPVAPRAFDEALISLPGPSAATTFSLSIPTAI